MQKVTFELFESGDLFCYHSLDSPGMKEFHLKKNFIIELKKKCQYKIRKHKLIVKYFKY